MKKQITLITTFIFILLFGSLIYGDDRNAPEWMNYTVGARANALGRSFAAFADDGTTTFNNPAGLPNIFESGIDGVPGNKLWLSFSWAHMPNKTDLFAFSSSFKIDKIVLGVSGLYTKGVNSLNPDRQPADGEKDYAWMPMISFAYSVNKLVNFGINMKFFGEKADNIKSNGMAWDVGGFIQVFEVFSIGFIVKNIGFIKYKDRKNRFIAPTVIAGIGYNPPGRRTFAFCFHIEKNTGSKNNDFKGSAGLFIAVYEKILRESSGEARRRMVDPSQELELSRRKKPSVYYNSIYYNLGFYGKEFGTGFTFNFFGFKLDVTFTINTTETNQYSIMTTLEKRF